MIKTVSSSETPASPESPPAVSVKALHKIYAAHGRQPAQEALCKINLDIPRGRIFGLLGPNGAGKSTFINILAGLVIKTSGQVWVWGFDADANPRQVRGSIGIVPQELTIDPFFTPREAMELQAGLYGVPKAARQTMAILDAMGLADKADAYARTLSGGMRRRLLVAKAMVHTPPILVLDEPTAGVDIELRKRLWAHVKELNDTGVTIILTTHYLEEAQALCDEIAIIDHGAVVAHASTDALLQQIDNKTLVVSLVSTLSEVPFVRGGKCNIRADGRLAIEYNPGEIAAGEILSQLAAANIEIIDLTTEGANLETVFTKITRHSNRI